MIAYNLPRDVPLFHPVGFQHYTVPSNIWELIQQAYAVVKPFEQPERFEGRDFFIKNSLVAEKTTLMDLAKVPALRQSIDQLLFAHVKAWANADIEPYALYGIRSYKRGCELTLHVDRLQSHHIGVIVCVDKKVDEDWALSIHDHSGVWHEIYLQPGQMVFYESAVCHHGRIKPFNGDYFNNLFAHYRLVDQGRGGIL